MKYLSVCSGIEAASVAWHPIGWNAVGYAEIEPFPCAVLKNHYPEVTNYGDLTKNAEWGIPEGSVDLLVGGTPCQAFSVAGLRKGLADPRGNLALVFLGLADRLKPRWVIWENVPGVLSSSGGRDFGAFLGALGQLGYGFAYRVLDAQFFGVPQRRRRVFVVSHLGDWKPAAAVLFEREGLPGNPPESRQKRQDVAPTLAARTKGGGGLGTDFDLDGGLVVNSAPESWKGPGFIHPRQLRNSQSSNQIGIKPDVEISDALTSEGPGAVFVSMRESGPGYWMQDQVAVSVDTNGARPRAGLICANQNDPADTVESSSVPKPTGGVRRLTPRECERIQGFPDDYTKIEWRGKPAEQCPDGPRYKSLGNSMAVPVMNWIGKRITK